MLYGDIPNLLLLLSLLVMGGVSYLIWWKAKAPAALLMLVGFGVVWLFHALIWFGVFGYSSFKFAAWMLALGFAVAAAGFVLTFWTKIQADVEKFREIARDRLSHAAQKGDGSGAAPKEGGPET